MPCNFVSCYKRFGRTYCLRQQDSIFEVLELFTKLRDTVIVRLSASRADWRGLSITQLFVGMSYVHYNRKNKTFSGDRVQRQHTHLQRRTNSSEERRVK